MFVSVFLLTSLAPIFSLPIDVARGEFLNCNSSIITAECINYNV